MIDIKIASLAFSAGLASFMNPCGFALLPVYVTYYFKNEGLENASFLKKLFFGILFGITVSAGFAITFLFVGLAISYLGRGLIKYFGWFDFIIGIILILVGLAYLFNLYGRFGLKLANIGEKLKSNRIHNKYASFFVYGIGFAIASLGCTLPIFLLVVTAAIETAGLTNGIITFLIYAAGMGIFMTVFSIIVAFSKTIVEKTLSKYGYYLQKIGAIVVIIAGAYLVYSQIAFGRIF